MSAVNTPNHSGLYTKLQVYCNNYKTKLANKGHF